MYLFKVDPLYKCVCVMVGAIMLSFTYSITLNACVFLISMLLILTGSNRIFTALKFVLAAFLPATGYLITGLYFGTDRVADSFISVSSFMTGINLATRLFAFAGLGMIFSLTTDPYDFMKSLQKKAKLPRKFAYGILCAFNLMPYIKDEFQNARLALQVRGVRLGLFSLKPVFSTLVNCIRWSETLSMAMQSKGFNDSDTGKSS